MSKKIILDASAVIAMIYQEKGADIVEKHLPNAIISSVNLTEIASFMIRQGNAALKVVELLSDLSLTVEHYSEEQAFKAAELIAKTQSKGLSLGDRACLALALVHNLPVLTADVAWKSVDVAIDIKLIQ